MGETRQTARMKVLLVVLALMAGLGEALKCSKCGPGPGARDEKCTDPGVEECEEAEDVCVFYLQTDGHQSRGCLDVNKDLGPGVADGLELDDNDKKCKKFDAQIDGLVCLCNYDGCN